MSAEAADISPERSPDSAPGGFQALMPYRIGDILLVSSLYDLYLFEEDGQLYELIRSEYQGLQLSHTPELSRVGTGAEALARARSARKPDLIITTLHVEDMSAARLARELRAANPSTPIVLLAYDNRELSETLTRRDAGLFDGVFVWHGDFRLIIAIVKQLEDRRNVAEDTEAVGVQSVILIEDSVQFYSSFLPLIYTEIIKQQQHLISEGVSITDRFLRMRARPKILLCVNYEQAWDYFTRYEGTLLGVISDIGFAREGAYDPRAGIRFAEQVKARHWDVPVILQSTSREFDADARHFGASILLKDSDTLLAELRRLIAEYFGFGDFVFRMPDGREVGRAASLGQLEELLRKAPAESIRYHAERNHFSKWLKARTEFWLAHLLRPRKPEDYPSVEDLRQDLIAHFQEYRHARRRGLVTEFTRETFDPNSSLARIGGGSLGGKARGLGFVNLMLTQRKLRDKFEGVQIEIPPGVAVGTDVFDEFLEQNHLRDFALGASDDGQITRRFVDAPIFPEAARRELEAFLERVREPLAVRSSSLLEDSQYHPFAGVYATYMIPNDQADPRLRLRELIDAVKRVYASTFHRAAKDYIKVTSYRLEEEKMAVIAQKLVGARRGPRFYPDLSGVARSHNFYPMPPQTAADGIASVALGLGRWVVDGGMTVRFSPRYPRHLMQFHSPADALRNSQSAFYALMLDDGTPGLAEAGIERIGRHPLRIAEQDGALRHVGSTYSPDNNALYDGLSRPGPRVVTFAPILRDRAFPLPEILLALLELGRAGMGTPVEIEFAATLERPRGAPAHFGVLQMRPLVLSRESEELEIARYPRERLLCDSARALGHGALTGIRDIVFVDRASFDRAATRDIAQAVGEINAKLVDAGRPYLLVGMGRWGTLDPWLGIPVKWDQISGARAIIEANFTDTAVEPSQGSHFFQNITSFQVGYLTVGVNDLLDWEWLMALPLAETRGLVRHARLDAPLTILMDGHNHRGVVVKPEALKSLQT